MTYNFEKPNFNVFFRMTEKKNLTYLQSLKTYSTFFYNGKW